MTTNYLDAAMNLSAKTRRETLEEVEALIARSILVRLKGYRGRVGTFDDGAAFVLDKLLDDIRELRRESV